MWFRRVAIVLTAMLVSLDLATPVGATTISAYWDDVALDYIQQTNSGPMAARMLTIMHTAMHDAWTAYDPIAVPSRANGILKRPPEETTAANQIEAISFAAHKALVGLLPSMASSIDRALARLGYNLEDAGSADTSTPPGVGNVAAKAVMAPTSSFDASNSIRYLPVDQTDSNDNPEAWRQVQTFSSSSVNQ